MKLLQIRTIIAVALALSAGIVFFSADAAEGETVFANPVRLPLPLDMEKAQEEVRTRYAKAHPEIQEYILRTARTFGSSGMWLNEGAYSGLSNQEREEKIKYLAALLNDAEYGRHLCNGLTEAGSLKDPRLVPGLMKIAAYHVEEKDYDCRPKWMAVAALARQESEAAVPLLISLLDHGNQNTRMWASAALVRKTGQNFGKNKTAWIEWCKTQGRGLK